MDNMYDIFVGDMELRNGVTYSPSPNEFILSVNGFSYDLERYRLPKEFEDSFYISGNETKNITVGLRFINKADKDQTYLADSGTQITANIKNNSFHCETVSSKPTYYYCDNADSIFTEGVQNLNSNWKVYVKETDIKEMCAIFPSGTVCMSDSNRANTSSYVSEIESKGGYCKDDDEYDRYLCTSNPEFDFNDGVTCAFPKGYDDISCWVAGETCLDKYGNNDINGGC